MEQIDDLTVLHKAGRDNVSRGINFDEMHKNPHLRVGYNTLNFLGAAAGTYFGGYVGFLWAYFYRVSGQYYRSSYDSCGNRFLRSLVQSNFKNYFSKRMSQKKG